MKSQFSLFNSHLDLAHQFWEKLVHPGDIVIDATCGNGYDTLYLAKLLQNKGQLYALDLQEKALSSTKALLREHKVDTFPISFILGCHSSFPSELTAESVRLIVYNLGYLPQSDKQIRTVSNTTLQSVAAGLPLIQSGGAISITCYPGHPEGKEEESALVSWGHSLSPSLWSVTHHRWLNRNNSPSLLIIQKQAS